MVVIVFSGKCAALSKKTIKSLTGGVGREGGEGKINRDLSFMHMPNGGRAERNHLFSVYDLALAAAGRPEVLGK